MELYIIVKFYLASRYTFLDLFCQKSEIHYDESMENPITSEVDKISDGDNDIDEPISKPTGNNIIWSSLIVLLHNPSTEETIGNYPINPLPTPTDFDLDHNTKLLKYVNTQK